MRYGVLSAQLVLTYPRHPGTYLTRSHSDNSTSNLNNHVKVCEPTLAEGEQSIAAYAAGSTYSPERFRYLVTMWVTKCHRPFIIIEDEPLQEILRMLYSTVEIPVRTTVSRDVQEVFKIAKKSVAEFLQHQDAAIQSDGVWTTGGGMAQSVVGASHKSNRPHIYCPNPYSFFPMVST